MRTFSKRLYIAAGAYTVSMGTGRKEFDPKKPRPGLEHYIQEAGRQVLGQISDPDVIDEGVISNFMAARFNRQGNLAALLPIVHPSLALKPHVRVEGACGSGGLALATAMKTVLAGLGDVVLALGVEVQNTVKALYGADILAGAGHYAGERKTGHAYFFPSKFSDRAGACYSKYGRDKTRRAMAAWYANAVENARRNPLAQEYHNTSADLIRLGMTPPDPETFTEHLSVFDCSKVSDGAAALLICSAEGLEKAGVRREDAVEIAGYGQAVADLTAQPVSLTELSTSKLAVSRAFEMSGIGVGEVGLAEVHDCFTITGLLSLDAIGFCTPGAASDAVLAGEIRRDGTLPVNPGGGLVGYGHPTGATGVRQAVDLWKQVVGRAGDAQVALKKEHGLMVSMGGNDKTVTALVVRR